MLVFNKRPGNILEVNELLKNKRICSVANKRFAKLIKDAVIGKEDLLLCLKYITILKAD